MEHPFLMFLDHTQRRSTVGRNPLDEWSARRRDLYMTTHDTHNRQISMPPVGFEPTISAGERPAAETSSGNVRRVERQTVTVLFLDCVTLQIKALSSFKISLFTNRHGVTAEKSWTLKLKCPDSRTLCFIHVYFYNLNVSVQHRKWLPSKTVSGIN